MQDRTHDRHEEDDRRDDADGQATDARGLTQRGQGDQPTRQGSRDQRRTKDVETTGDVLAVPVGQRSPAPHECDDRSGGTQVEDPAPRRHQQVERDRPGQSSPHEGRSQVEVLQDGRTQEWTQCHAQEIGRAHGTQGAWPRRPREQPACACRRERQDGATAKTLHDPGQDQLMQRACRARQHRADREHRQRPQQQWRQPEPVGGPAGQRHRGDVRQQIAIDHPTGQAKLVPSPRGRPRYAAARRPWPSVPCPPAPTPGRAQRATPGGNRDSSLR